MFVNYIHNLAWQQTKVFPLSVARNIFVRTSCMLDDSYVFSATAVDWDSVETSTKIRSRRNY